jgi:hypothetical protein
LVLLSQAAVTVRESRLENASNTRDRLENIAVLVTGGRLYSNALGYNFD